MPLAEPMEKQFKSPVRKLLPFFQRSRNGWKRKCAAAKAAVRRLENRMGKLEVSRQRWKELAQEQSQELKRLRRELDAQKK